MSRTGVAVVLAVLAAGTPLFVASPAGASGQAAVRDDLGYEFKLGAPPRRIVSLAPNITEVLFALGLEDQVAGVTRYCDFPPQAAGKPKVGGMTDPDLEKIQALEPDLVVAFRGNPLEAVRKMRNLRLPVFVLDMGGKMDEVLTMISRVGTVTGRRAEADALVRRLAAVRDEVRERLKKASSRVRAIVLLPGEGLWTCGSGSYLHDLLEQSGGRNIAADIPRPWASFSRESLFAADPDVLVILARNTREFKKETDRLAGDSRLKNLTAVRRGRFVLLEENKASRFGPRLLEAYSSLARALHPECF